MDQHETDRLAVTVAEAARALGISRSSLYAEIKHGPIPTFRLAGRMLVPWAALHALVGSAAGSIPKPNTEPDRGGTGGKDPVEAFE